MYAVSTEKGKMKEIKDTHFSREEKGSSDLVFYACGNHGLQGGMSYGPVIRNYYVIHFVSAGKGKLYIHNQEFDVGAGQAFLLPAQIPHYYVADQEDPWQYSWVSFLGLHAAAYFQMLQQACPNGFVTPVLNIGWYASHIEKMLQVYSEDWAGFFRTNALVSEILGQLCEELKIQNKAENREGKMAEIRYFIDMNIGKNLRVAEIAEKFCYHPNYLSRSFAEQYGLSPKKYILQLKLQKAEKLIREGSDSISLIALALGFPDEPSFSRAFKKRYGCSPASLRE